MPKTTLSFYLHIIAVAVIVVALSHFFYHSGNNGGQTQIAAKESVYDRVMRTGTIRCGYWNWEPVFSRDVNTGQTTGIFYDVMNEFGRISNLNIEWTQEVQFANLITDLQTQRIDAVCAGVWASAVRSKSILFSDPIFYIPINAYVRTDDNRFDFKPDSINDPAIKIAVMDGEMSSEVHSSDFPRAQIFAVPQIAGSGTDLIMNVTSGKADVTFTDAVNGLQFMKSNPGTTREVRLETPIRLIPNTIAVDGSELRFKAFVNDTLEQLHNSGVIEKILRKYDVQFPRTIYRVAKPYQLPAN